MPMIEPEPGPRSARPRRSAPYGGCRCLQRLPERLAQRIGIALHDGRGWIAIAQQRTETGIVFDENELRRIDAALDQRVGDRAGPRAELDDGSRCIRIDKLRHSPRKQLARGHDGPHVQRLFNPRAKKANLIVEARRLLFLDAQS